jgi:transposase
MIEAHGIAAGTATEMLLLVSDNPDRIRSEAAFAKLCGACPIPASSGKTTRHRLNRGGNRQANAARTAGSSSACAATSRPSTTSGDTRPKERKMEIIRCLKRFMAREIFGYLCREPKLPLVAQSDP